MNQKYSWWKLLKAQYSWKNDRWSVYTGIVLSLIITLHYIVTDSVVYIDTGKSVEVFSLVTFSLGLLYFFNFIILYHSVKFLFVGILLCGGVTYFANNGEGKDKLEAIEQYQTLLTWRK